MVIQRKYYSLLALSSHHQSEIAQTIFFLMKSDSLTKEQQSFNPYWVPTTLLKSQQLH
jgi:hypothetical protein